MENVCTIKFRFIPGARGINRKSEKNKFSFYGKIIPRARGTVKHLVLRVRVWRAKPRVCWASKASASVEALGHSKEGKVSMRKRQWSSFAS